MNSSKQIIVQGNRFGKLAAMKKMVQETLARKNSGDRRNEVLIFDYWRIIDKVERK